MSQTRKPQPIEGVLTLPAYQGGRVAPIGEDRAAKAAAEIYKLSANENALGASPQAYEALARLPDMALYPDGQCTALRDALAQAHNIEAARIVCGAGSGDLLLLLAHGFLQAGDEFIISEHGFLLYALAGQQAGARAVRVPERALTIDVEAICQAVSDKTKMVFIANPNNPTGTMLNKESIMDLISRLRPDILLVIDEAYREYVDADIALCDFADIAHYDNVVITRTFSKAYGLASLRLGWCYCPPDIADVLQHLRGPFNVSAPAQAAGLAALADSAHIEASRRHNQKWRAWLQQECAALNMPIRSAYANFILLEFADAAQAAAGDEFLYHKGIIARALDAYGLPHALRLTVGSEAANRAAIKALADFTETLSS